MEELELTQEEQEYNAEYEKAFFGTGEEEKVEEVEDDAEQQLQEVDAEEETGEDPAEEDGSISEEGEAVSEDTDDGDSDSDEPVDSESDDTDAESAVEEDPEEELETIVWKGKEVKVTKDEMKALAQKGFDYTSKTQVISDYKKQIKALEDAGITEADIALYAKAKKGDKEALAYITQSSGVDAVDLLDVEPNLDLHNPEPEVLISDSVAPLVEQVQSNPEVFASMQDAVSKLPKAVTNAMQQDAVWFNDVYTQVTSGNFEKVIPQVQLRLAQMDDVQRTYHETNPEAFASLYIEVSSGGANQSQITEAVETPTPEPVKTVKKPNMAEVGVKRNGGKDRRAEVKKDAFTSDEAYQATLARMKRW